MKIPCVGILTYTNPECGLDLIRAIDCEVGTFVIINNGPYPHETWQAVADQNNLIEKVIVQTQPNTGCAAGWNRIIQSAPASDYWVILNDDLDLGPGDLERFAVDIESSKPSIAICTVAPIGLAIMGVKRVAIEHIGFFDENFWPCFNEDLDYLKRVTASREFELLTVPGYASRHEMGRLGSDPRIQYCVIENRRYYNEKWPSKDDPWALPWGDKPLRSWSLDLDRRNKLMESLKAPKQGGTLFLK